jgi:predicted RNA-binding protein with PUA-like domain
MSYFLAKTEPDTYSIDRLAHEKKTTWDGVTNPQAVNAIKKMKSGDKVFIYHSGGISAVVGLAIVLTEPKVDPRNPKSAIVDLGYLQHLEPPTTLKEVKESKKFEDFALVRQGRLSTMEVPQPFVDWLRKRYPGQRF